MSLMNPSVNYNHLLSHQYVTISLSTELKYILAATRLYFLQCVKMLKSITLAVSNYILAHSCCGFIC